MIRIALSKGRLSKEAYKSFSEIGLAESLDLKSRKLLFKDIDNEIEYILLKPKDVVTYVENGIADMGVVGSDVIMESEKEIYELFDFEFGKCKFSVASSKNNQSILDKDFIKVATKYPKVSQKYFNSINKKIEIIPLGGSVELAPIVGLSDVIVDIVETGSTLKANDLEIVKDLYNVSARLICNKVSYRFNKEIMTDIVKKLRSVENENY